MIHVEFGTYNFVVTLCLIIVCAFFFEWIVTLDACCSSSNFLVLKVLFNVEKKVSLEVRRYLTLASQVVQSVRTAGKLLFFCKDSHDVYQPSAPQQSLGRGEGLRTLDY